MLTRDGYDIFPYIHSFSPSLNLVRESFNLVSRKGEGSWASGFRKEGLAFREGYLFVGRGLANFLVL